MSRQLAALLVAVADDHHADLVHAALRRLGTPVARTSLADLRSTTIHWASGGEELTIFADDKEFAVGPTTAVWWRRPGVFSPAGATPPEAELAHDEAAVILPGALEAAGVRWVESPWLAERARNRLVQLAAATRLGIPVPETIASSDRARAAGLLARGRVVAKTVSTGPGLAPFVDEIADADLDFVSAAPLVLQRLLAAAADWRLVLVGEACVGWTRGRSAQSEVDWRRDDPRGTSFRRAPVPGQVREDALRIQTHLGISTSVQDWVQTTEGWHLLEVGVQSQWAFLKGSAAVIPDLLAAHLTARSLESP